MLVMFFSILARLHFNFKEYFFITFLHIDIFLYLHFYNLNEHLLTMILVKH